MLKCVEVTELCSRELERPLRLGEQMALGMHFMLCTGCSNYRRQMRVLRKVAQAYADGQASAAAPGEPLAK